MSRLSAGEEANDEGVDAADEDHHEAVENDWCGHHGAVTYHSARQPLRSGGHRLLLA